MSSFSEEYRHDRQARSLKQVEQGGLPLDAEWRLNRLRENNHLFTGNLSVSELALCVSSGIRPLGQVMGASTYKVGWQFVVPNRSQELPVQTQAHSHARVLAIGRLQQEAKLIGADGVIGVRLERKFNESSPTILEYHAFGTAVRMDGPNRWQTPFIAAITVQELWSLRRAGHFPVGFVFGGCVFYHVASITTQYLQGTLTGARNGYTRNIELTEYSQAVYVARRKAMGLVEFEAQALGADGVVGVTVEHKVETREVEMEVNEIKQRRRDLIVHFTAFGTAIMPVGDTPYAVDYMVSLD